MTVQCRPAWGAGRVRAAQRGERRSQAPSRQGKRRVSPSHLENLAAGDKVGLAVHLHEDSLGAEHLDAHETLGGGAARLCRGRVKPGGCVGTGEQRRRAKRLPRKRSRSLADGCSSRLLRGGNQAALAKVLESSLCRARQGRERPVTLRSSSLRFKSAQEEKAKRVERVMLDVGSTGVEVVLEHSCVRRSSPLRWRDPKPGATNAGDRKHKRHLHPNCMPRELPLHLPSALLFVREAARRQSKPDHY